MFSRKRVLRFSQNNGHPFWATTLRFGSGGFFAACRGDRFDQLVTDSDWFGSVFGRRVSCFRLPRHLHFEVPKVLCLPRNLHRVLATASGW